MSTTTGRLPSSATSTEAVANRKSPTSVAARSPSCTCIVCSPRLNSAASRMSSCTSEAECKTSMLAARDATRLKRSFSAPMAFATSSVSAGLSLFPPVRKSAWTDSATSLLEAGADKPVPSRMPLTSISCFPTQRSAPSSAALGPCAGHGGAGGGSSASGLLSRPAPMSACSSRSDASSLEKPRPLAMTASSFEGYTISPASAGQ
mmetsp:Transcript_50438/g.131033  ORF Transcript_50438/g.131033 Transcript_50438/m.131033 type:complete len:205 (-) Transcript_50438:1156-1770(-)